MPPGPPDPRDWPFAPGDSPYRIKGTAYRGHIEYVEEHIDGGLPAMIDAFEDERHRAFFGGPFLAGGLYDIFPLVVAGDVCARLLGMTFLDFVAERSRIQAPKDLGGIYRFLLRMVPTGTVAKRIPMMLGQVLEFGTTEVLQDEPHHMRGVFHGMPSPIAPWFSTVSEAYGTEALRVSGSDDPKLTIERSTPMPAEKGVALVSLTFDIRW